MGTLRARVSYANVAATVAVVLALGGGAIAAGGGGDPGSVVGGHLKGLSDDGPDAVVAVPGVIRLRAFCSAGAINPGVTNLSTKKLKVVRVLNGNSASKLTLDPGAGMNYGTGGGLRYSEVQVFPAGDVSRPVATAFVTTETAESCGDAEIAAQIVAAGG